MLAAAAAAAASSGLHMQRNASFPHLMTGSSSGMDMTALALGSDGARSTPYAQFIDEEGGGGGGSVSVNTPILHC